MKLWRVDLEFAFYISAENEADAEHEARGAVEDAMYDSRSDRALAITEVTKLEHIDRNWRDAVPYGRDEESDLTCQQVFAASQGGCPHGVPNGEACAACLEAAGQLRLPSGPQ